MQAQSPEAEAGCCARVFFTWPNPIFVRGNAKVEGAKGEKVNYHLDEKDMFPLLPTDQADHREEHGAIRSRPAALHLPSSFPALP